MVMTKTSKAEKRFRHEVSADLRILAVLHDREPDPTLIEDLRSAPAENWFGMALTSETSLKGIEVFNAALGSLPRPLTVEALNQLAADYSNIYLIHAYRVTPTESPWLDKDHLERQGPMFSIAAWYRRYGLAARDRQKRSDDHLVLQLQFIGHLIEHAEGTEGLREAARFMDAHILQWIGEFCERVAARCQTPYYAGLVTVTLGYLEELREQLVSLADAPRPAAKNGDAERATKQTEIPEPAPYVPGTAPSW